MGPPIKPDESDCCNSGCNPCILDVYEDQLRKYLKGKNNEITNINNCLSPTAFATFKLVNIVKYTKNCNLYTFECQGPERLRDGDDDQTNLLVHYEPGQHLLVKARIHGEFFQKAYTPVFVKDQPKNQFTIVVRLYPNGRMSRFFQRLEVGISTLWRGPYGDYKTNYEEENLLFIAQGTGIAPFYTILCDILSNEDCYTFTKLFFCCHNENLIFREELYEMQHFWNFKYELFVSGSKDNAFQVKYNEVVNFSRLGIKDIMHYLKDVKGHYRILVCGAQSFCDNVKNMLGECKVPDNDIVIF